VGNQEPTTKSHLPRPRPKGSGDCAAPKKTAQELTPVRKVRAKETAAFKAQTRNQVGLLAIGGVLLLAVGLVATRPSFMQSLYRVRFWPVFMVSR